MISFGRDEENVKIYKDMLWTQKPNIAATQVRQDTIAQVAVWTQGTVVKELLDPENDVWVVGVNLMTAYGMDRASETDYIARAQDGEFHIFRASDFENRYEEVGVVKVPTPRGLKPRPANG